MHRIRLNNGLLDIPQATPPQWASQYVTASPRAQVDPRLSIFYAIAPVAQIRERETTRRAAPKPPSVKRGASRRRRVSWGMIAFRQELARVWS
ncbi:hypothetical protein [Paraburkholderia ferrariae]|uniref:hypothetical protein n=1 Tax=Paraburkholderia ferrariae TaxID=386056 RepID=UPI000486C532|nr:hypothetical protein [Paraburkholderia ferrariae]